MAHYPFLAEIGSDYQDTFLNPGGEVGKEGHRRGFLDMAAGNLRTALINLAAAEAAAQPAVFTGSVRERALKFQNAEATAEAAKKLVYTRRAKVEFFKRYLERMGAKVDANNHIDWGFSARTVVYDNSPAVQGATRIRVHGGRLFTDDAHRQWFDTRLMVTANMGPGHAIYVMSETGNIHVSSHSVGHRHHSSLLGGSNVAGAGEMKVHAGQLKWISNKSGHYFPEVTHLLQTLHSLMKKGVDLAAVQLSFLSEGGPPRGQPYGSVPEFLAAKRAEGVPDYEYAKLVQMLCLVPFTDFAAAAAVKGWRWCNEAEFAAGGRGVRTMAGTEVPHRDVRKWLKIEWGRVPRANQLVKPGR